LFDESFFEAFLVHFRSLPSWGFGLSTRGFSRKSTDYWLLLALDLFLRAYTQILACLALSGRPRVSLLHNNRQ